MPFMNMILKQHAVQLGSLATSCLGSSDPFCFSESIVQPLIAGFAQRSIDEEGKHADYQPWDSLDIVLTNPSRTDIFKETGASSSVQIYDIGILAHSRLHNRAVPFKVQVQQKALDGSTATDEVVSMRRAVQYEGVELCGDHVELCLCYHARICVHGSDCRES